MTQEQKDLLLNDLCARLSYGVKISIPELWTSEKKIEVLNEIFKGDDGLYRVNDNGMLIEHIKPYLFPLSSMTEEQLLELSSISFENSIDSSIKTLNYCYKNHFDIYGLIHKGLAIDATGKNIY